MYSRNIYSQYYLDQAGYGVGGNVFRGTRIQRGYGIGGFFSSLFRSAVPMLKQGAKTVGKALLRTGLDIASDAMSGRNIKESAEERFQQTGRDLANKAVDHLRSQVGSGPFTFHRNRVIRLKHMLKRKRANRKKSDKPKKRRKTTDILS